MSLCAIFSPTLFHEKLAMFSPIIICKKILLPAHTGSNTLQLHMKEYLAHLKPQEEGINTIHDDIMTNQTTIN